MSEQITQQASSQPRGETSKLPTPKPTAKRKSIKTSIANRFKKLRLKPGRKQKYKLSQTNYVIINDYSVKKQGFMEFTSDNSNLPASAETSWLGKCPQLRSITEHEITEITTNPPVNLQEKQLKYEKDTTRHPLLGEVDEHSAHGGISTLVETYTIPTPDHVTLLDPINVRPVNHKTTNPNPNAPIPYKPQTLYAALHYSSWNGEGVSMMIGRGGRDCWSDSLDDTSYGSMISLEPGTFPSDTNSLSMQPTPEATANTRISNQSHCSLVPNNPQAREEYLSDSSDDIDDWIETVERKIDIGEDCNVFRDPPAELLELIYSACMTRGVRRIVWSQDVGKPNHYIVKAAGIPEDVRHTLEKEVSDQFPDCSVKLVDTERITHNLSAHIIETNCNPCHKEPIWAENDRAACELIVTGTQVDRNETGYFCVTSAHLLMTRDESLAFDRVATAEQENSIEFKEADGENNVKIRANGENSTLNKEAEKENHTLPLEVEDRTENGNNTLNVKAVLKIKTTDVEDERKRNTETNLAEGGSNGEIEGSNRENSNPDVEANRQNTVETEAAEGGINVETANLKLKDLREKLLLRKYMYSHSHRLCLNGHHTPSNIWLPGMAMLGYRVFINDTSKPFQNDIALFAIEDVETLDANFMDNSFCHSKYHRKLLSRQEILKLTGATVFIREYEGILVPPQRSYPEDALGLHISFTLSKPTGQEKNFSEVPVLRPGDSGSVVYVKVDGKQKPLALLKGIRAKRMTEELESEEETQAEKNTVYDAILLNAALQDIEQDYSHLVRNLRVFTRPLPLIRVIPGGHEVL